MKRIICLITVLCLVFGSFSFCFAQDWSATDSQNLSNAASRLQTIITTLQTTNSTLNTISNRVLDIKNALFDDNHSVAYWASAISTWMSPIYLALTTNFRVNSGIEFVISGLNEVTGDSSSGYTYTPYLKYGGKSNANWLSDIDFKSAAFISGYNNPQGYYNPTDLSVGVYTPATGILGIYNWLFHIEEGTARLSYVLASPERIEAQQAAAANEEAVVDNFIDSSGDGSATPSDFGSISDLSSGYKSNFGSDASVSGIFNIFNSNNMGWFSQETANQLDTTTPTRRGSSFNTPLLDRQINDIYYQIGVNND